MSTVPHLDQRILIFTPGGSNAARAARILSQAGLFPTICPTSETLCQALESNAGAVLLSDMALTPSTVTSLQAILAEQPPWSALPLVLLLPDLMRHRPSLSLQRFLAQPKVTVLERPVTILALVSALRTALAARRRQYQVRDLLNQLEGGVRQRDQFLAMLGHELRNPLAPIRSTLDLLRLRGELSPELVLIDHQTRHLTNLVNDLLDVTRVITGRITLHRTMVAMDSVIQEARIQATPTLQARRHRLSMDLPNPVPMVEGDAERLIQVIANLLDNAAKYTPPGGDVTLGLTVQSPWAVLTVSDTGQGIPPELQASVFEVFRQGPRTLARSEGGLGLGLALVKHLVELHRGDVAVHSPGPGRGSTFTVRLPLARAEPGAATEAATTAPAPHSARRILIVEDDPAVARSLTMLLQSRGHMVALAPDGETALIQARCFAPQVVLLDLGLPGMDGFEVARQLRVEHGPALPLVALSGYGSAQDLAQAQAAGIDQHLLKPVDLARLEAMLAALPPA